MMRRALAIIATMALSGCQHSGQQAVDPFWGRTTVPAPATGAVGVNPCYPQPATVSAGPSNALQATPPPNLLPATASPTPAAPATITPAPAMPAPAATGAPYVPSSPAIPAPPDYRAPPSGYSSLGPAPSGAGASSPATTYPGAPTSPAPPSTGGTPSSPAPADPATTPSPAGSPPPTSPGYSPPGGYRYDGQKSTGPSASGAGAATTGSTTGAVSLDGAMVSAPPSPATSTDIAPGPSVVRIPASANGDWSATPASAAARP